MEKKTGKSWLKKGKTAASKKEFTMGADPELFIEREDGSVFPAWEFLPSKYEPEKTSAGQNVYWDGVQAEFTVAPSTKIGEVLDSIRLGLARTIELARLKDAKARIGSRPVIDVSLDWLKTLPAELSAFGCMPSENAYEIGGMATEGVDCPYRFSGGHIHLGTGPREAGVNNKIVRDLDATAGLACVSLFENIDNPVRRRWYGLPGEYREPPHGCEYRPLSNAWMSNPKTADMIFDFVRQVVNASLAGSLNFKAEQEEIIESIILCDVGKARGLMERNADVFKRFTIKHDIDLMKPVEKQLNMTDVEKNWKIV